MDNHRQEARMEAPQEQEDIQVVQGGEGNGAILQFLRDTDIGKIKNEVLRPPIPDCDDDGGSVASERERGRGREYLISLL